ncbi:universal stress protein [Nocardioides phosphati]|uniref:Universal stress protein n=1 Tax=Nocardioides phosphati TaxID=1867775 RepID=A0ABQ2N6D8_9ACTN|nr:universal stress protein [Nocardioides phosphati]GGO86211.1 universal stress protein [Nocardioides phosphati]
MTSIQPPDVRSAAGLAAHPGDPVPAVVVGVDGSASNHAAVAYAAELADRTGRPLRLTAVIDPTAGAVVRRPAAPRAPGFGEGFEALHAGRARATQDHPDLAVTETARSGSPAVELTEAAREEAVLVVGRRGLGATRRLLLGSTSLGAARRSSVPVVVVPDDAPRPARPDAPVVVAVHPGTSGRAELDYGFAQAQDTGAPVVVVRVSSGREVTPYDTCFGPVSDAQDAPLPALVAGYLERFPGVRVRTTQPTGSAAGQLLREAAGASLLVLGRHRHGPFGVSLGTVARTVLRQAPLPVAVVPSMGPPEAASR